MTYAVAGLKTGDKIGKATVHVDLVKKGNAEIRTGKAMTPRYITIHNTGNTGKGADAEAHNKLIHNMAGRHPRDTSHVSWHVAIDENDIYIHIPFNETAWHCGDGTAGAGNSSSIGLEICMHSNQKNYMQAEENAIALCVHLLGYYKLDTKDVRPHQDWSGKYCPQVILKRDGTFTKFRSRVDVASKLPNTSKEAEKVYSSKSLKAEHEVTRSSAGRQKIIVEAAIEAGYSEMWRDKLNSGEITPDDVDALAVGTLVKISK